MKRKRKIRPELIKHLFVFNKNKKLMFNYLDDNPRDIINLLILNSEIRLEVPDNILHIDFDPINKEFDVSVYGCVHPDNMIKLCGKFNKEIFKYNANIKDGILHVAYKKI